MSKINVLSPHLADLIAAGEVVEKPASVIKELVENSIDAGAKNITVEIRRGGISFIKVTDDGCGMSPEDLGIAYLRHATSKLHDESGLAGIATMGFRGEALAAISSVCRMEITSKDDNSQNGTKLTLIGGEIDSMDPCGHPRGTTIICKDLFYNTPARLKFMKSDRAEASACEAAALKCAMGRPDVSVKFIKDCEDGFFTPGDGKIDSCLYALLGRDEASSMLKCNSSLDKYSIKGFISSPAEGRGNRSHQYFFINGRCIKSALLQSALEQAYRNTLLVNKYPYCALYIDIPFNAVDVNVHPAKTEVRFCSEREIFDFVYHAVKMTLEAENRNTIDQYANDSRPLSNNYTIGGYTSRVDVDAVPSSNYSKDNQIKIDLSPVPHEPNVGFSPVNSNSQHDDSQSPAYEPAYQNHSANVAQTISSEKNFNDFSNAVSMDSTTSFNIIGEAFKTYIIVDNGENIILIDKHAAHERMIFNKLKQENYVSSSQLLLRPETLHLDGEEAEILESNGELLSDIGFEIEPFGANEYIIRSIPSDMDYLQAKSGVEEIITKIKEGHIVDPSALRDEALHTVACKAAIKAGWDTNRRELQVLVDAVLSGEIKYCPHGRPVSIPIDRKDLDKLFKRIV